MSSVYGVTMQWTPDQPQWAEQYYDITSTTRSPAHKFEVYGPQRLTSSSSTRAYQHSWANDDISALTASNLLKRYAERYSSILDLPCESGLMGYPDPTISASVNGPNVVNGAPPLLNGRKLEVEPWLEGVYPPLACVPELVPKAPLSVSDLSTSVCSSPGVGMPEPSFSSTSCSSQNSVQEYSSTLYSAPYLQSVATYNGPLLHPVASHPGLVPAYSTNTSPSLPTYGYPSAGYPSQGSLSQGYSAPSPPTACLSAGIAPATPLPASSMGGYSYPAPSLAPVAPSSPGDVSPNTSGLGKAYFSGQSDLRAFEEFGFGGTSSSESLSANSSFYRPPGGREGPKGNGFEQGTGGAFKPANHSDSLRSLESLAATTREHSSATRQGFATASCSAASSNTYPSTTPRTHLCLDTHTPC
ncbi:fidgetin [Electrophorus electricus]|uniref:fidgetin n=1 Tax=Electrophorus electricus TaxID=8005 RepID=UPI0015D0116F|nr:fidgetin [Electrophorus electricus]